MFDLNICECGGTYRFVMREPSGEGEKRARKMKGTEAPACFNLPSFPFAVPYSSFTPFFKYLFVFRSRYFLKKKHRTILSGLFEYY